MGVVNSGRSIVTSGDSDALFLNYFAGGILVISEQMIGGLGMTALLYAVDGDYSECVRELLEAGARPDGGPCCPTQASVEDRRPSNTPLVSAIINNSLSSARLLLQVVNSDGKFSCEFFSCVKM